MVSLFDFRPVPVKTFNVLFNQGVAALHFNDGERGDGSDGVEMACGYDGAVACPDVAHLAVEDEEAFSLDEGPYFLPVLMALVGDVFAWVDGYAFGEGVVAVGIYGVVNDAVVAPAALFVHRAWGEIVHCVLYAFGVFFFADYDAVRAGCDYGVCEAVDVDGVMQFVDYVGVAAVGAHYGVAYYGAAEFFCEGVPGAEVLPLAAEWNYGY